MTCVKTFRVKHDQETAEDRGAHRDHRTARQVDAPGNNDHRAAQREKSEQHGVANNEFGRAAGIIPIGVARVEHCCGDNHRHPCENQFEFN